MYQLCGFVIWEEFCIYKTMYEHRNTLLKDIYSCLMNVFEDFCRAVVRMSD